VDEIKRFREKSVDGDALGRCREGLEVRKGNPLSVLERATTVGAFEQVQLLTHHIEDNFEMEGYLLVGTSCFCNTSMSF
jgi:hypothetical protein